MQKICHFRVLKRRDCAGYGRSIFSKAECSHKPLHLQWTKNQIKSTKLGLELLDSKTLELLRLPKLSRFSGLPNKRKKQQIIDSFFFSPNPSLSHFASKYFSKISTVGISKSKPGLNMNRTHADCQSPEMAA